MPEWAIWVIWGSVGVQAVWAWRLYRLSLGSRYRGLLTYLLGSTCWYVVAYLIRATTTKGDGWSSFAWFYVSTRPLVWLLFFVVLFECYDRMVDKYPGVRRVGQLLLYGAVGSSVALVVLLMLGDPSQAGSPRYWYRICLIHDQSVYLGAALSVVALFWFRRFFSLPLASNVALVFGVFGIYFVGTASVYLLEGWGGLPDVSWLSINTAGPVLYLVCLTIGVLRFSMGGEAIHRDPRLESAPGSLQFRVAERQLEQMNEQLMKVLKK